jgi:pseudaminic acid biosynthesis-associated methylase
MVLKTEQEEFWSGDFGNEYIARNDSANYLASNVNFFAKALSSIQKPVSILEFGANIGMNLKAVRILFPDIEMSGIEINQKAASQLAEVVGVSNVYNGSILDYQSAEKYDICLIKGVLIHINPEFLNDVYDKLYESSGKYILVCEYYNPSPVTIQYRGHADKLFKRDFAGEILDRFPDLKLVNYGFCYRRDQLFPQDDLTWFLLEKQG